jgi:MFS family permease
MDEGPRTGSGDAAGASRPVHDADPAWVGPLVAMLAVQTAASFLSRIAPTLAPALGPRVGWSAESVGFLSSLITGGSILVLLLAAPVQRRYGPMRTLQLGLALGVAGCLLSALPSGAALVLGSLLIGVSIGPPSSAGSDVLQRYSPPHHRNLLFSVKQAGVPLGGALAGLSMPWAAQALGLGTAFALAAALGVAALLAVQPLRQRIDADRERSLRLGWRRLASISTWSGPLTALLSQAPMRRMGLAGGCLAAGQAAWFAFLVTYLVSELQWTLTAAGALFALMQALSVLGRPLAGFVSDRIGDGVRVLRWLAGGSAATTLAFAFTAPQWPAWTVVVLAMISGITVASWNGVQFAQVARLAQRGALNEAMAGATLVLLAAYVLSPALISTLLAAGGSFRTAFVLVALASAAALIPLSRFKTN